MNPLPPARSTASLRACDSGSSGRGNGTRSSTTRLQEGPGTSTPCQSPSVPNRQVRGSAANCLTRVGTTSSPCSRTGRSVLARTTSAAAVAARREENNPSVRPPAASTRATSSSCSGSPCPSRPGAGRCAAT